MGQDEGPVELIFRQGTRVEVGSRSGADVDAVALDAFHRMSRSPTLATAHQDRETGGAAVNALCGRVEIVGDAVDLTKPGHYSQATDECELGRWHLLRERVQGADQTRGRPTRPIEKEDLTRHERGLPDSIPQGSPGPDRDPGPGPTRSRHDWPPGSRAPGAEPVPTTRTGTGTPPPVQPTVYPGTHRGSGARFVARLGSPRSAPRASLPWPPPEPDARGRRRQGRPCQELSQTGGSPRYDAPGRPFVGSPPIIRSTGRPAVALTPPAPLRGPATPPRR